MNHRPLCLSPRCKTDPDTGVVMSRYAADGLLLCIVCRNMIGEDVLIAAVRYRQLGLVLTGTGQAGEERANRSKPDANLALNLRAASVRRKIEHEVGHLVKLISDRRGHPWPTESRIAERPLGFIGPMPMVHTRSTRLPVLARFVARSRDWLAAHDKADEHAAILRELATGEAYRVAFPGGTRRFILPGIGPEERYLECPEEVEGGPCPGVLWTVLRKDGDYLPSQIACNHDETHQWPISTWMKLGRRLLRRAGRAAA
jgi:hypothetical protein